MSAVEVSALMTVLDNKLEAHLEQHREAVREHEHTAQDRQRHIALILSAGMLVSPLIATLTTHFLH